MRKIDFPVIYISLTLLLSTSTGYSQLIDWKKDKVIKYMKKNDGILKYDKIHQGGIIPGLYNVLGYHFTPQVVKKKGIVSEDIYLNRKEICFQYVSTYISSDFKQLLINSYNLPNSGLIQQGKKLAWVNKTKKYHIQILTTNFSNGPESEVFMVEVRKVD